MAKTFQVEIGGKVRALRFHQRDAIELKKRFNDTPHRLVFSRVMGFDFEHAKPGKPPRQNPALFDPEVQYAVLHRALLRGGWNVGEDKVIDAVDEAIQAGDGKVSAGDFFAPAAKCALYSGAITGGQVDLDDEDETPETTSGAAEGKASTSGDQG